jgi:uncharacterized protein YkwD
MKVLARFLLSLFLIVTSTPFAYPVHAADPWGGHVYLPVITATTASQPNTNEPAWLSYLNAYRAGSKLPLVTEDASLSAADLLHAKYTVINNTLSHSEDSSKPGYTTEGNNAASHSNVMASSGASTSDEDAIDMWLQGPFHALGMLDPHLTITGFGSYRDSGASGIRMAAAIDVWSKRSSSLPAGASYPVMWPGNGATVALSAYYGNESPNPLASCSGYSAPTGLPIILQVGNGSQTPNVTGHSFAQGSTSLDSCVFDQTTFTGDAVGKSILNGRDGIVLIPRAPLSAGKTYSVSITDRGTVYAWSFTIAH